MEAIKPARGLFLDFQWDGEWVNQMILGSKEVIHAAFDLLDAKTGPVLEDFPEVIHVRDGRMGYALPPELVLNTNDIGDVDALVAAVQAEMAALLPDYEAAVAARGRTTVGASELEITDFAPFVSEFIRGEIPKSPRKGLPAIPF